MSTPDGCNNFVRVYDPAERFWVLVYFFDEAVDSGLQGDDAVEHAAFQPAKGQFGEGSLDGVAPGGGDRCEVEGEAAMPPEPHDDLGMFVGRVGVEHNMNLFIGRKLALNGVERADELLMGVALHAPVDNLTLTVQVRRWRRPPNAQLPQVVRSASAPPRAW